MIILFKNKEIDSIKGRMKSEKESKFSFPFVYRKSNLTCFQWGKKKRLENRERENQQPQKKKGSIGFVSIRLCSISFIYLLFTINLCKLEFGRYIQSPKKKKLRSNNFHVKRRF